MKYLIEKDKNNKFHVLYKKHWWHRWKYCRRPIGKNAVSNYTPIWQWNTEKAAQAYINQKLKN
jgi:hypothetical protein